MAKFRKGILGPISGKLGPVVGATWKGIPYLRSAPKVESKVQPSAAQLAGRQKFKFLNLFLVPFHPYLNNGFRNNANNKTEINAGFTANFPLVSGECPDFLIDLSRLRLSSGSLAGLANPQISWTDDQRLKLTWVIEKNRVSNFDDQVMLVVYCAETQQIDGFVGGVKRAAKQAFFNLDEKFNGLAVHIYVVMLALNGRSASNTTYLGRMEWL